MSSQPFYHWLNQFRLFCKNSLIGSQSILFLGKSLTYFAMCFEPWDANVSKNKGHRISLTAFPYHWYFNLDNFAWNGSHDYWEFRYHSTIIHRTNNLFSSISKWHHINNYSLSLNELERANLPLKETYNYMNGIIENTYKPWIAWMFRVFPLWG